MFYFIKKYWKHIFFVFSFVIVLLGGIIYYQNSNVIDTNSIKKMDDVTVTKASDEKKLKTVFVDVKGAVAAPGVYELDDGKRVIDAINLAGGLAKDANVINLNLSKKVTDEMYVIVYTKEEINNFMKNNANSKIECASKECVCPGEGSDACIKSPSSESESNGKVSINSATKEALMGLSGIGEAKAEAILKYRTENGGFKALEDIKNVDGIGEAIYDKVKNNITL